MAIIRVTSNPSDFVYVSGNQTINGTKNFQTRPTVDGASVLITSDISALPPNPSDLVYATGNQEISGLKDFQTRPTVTDVPVLISGDLAEIKNFSIAMAIALS